MPRLHLLEGNLMRLGVIEIEETSQGDGANLPTSVLGVRVVRRLVLLPHGVLQVSDTGRVVDVRLASVSPVVLSRLGEAGRKDGIAGRVASLVRLEGVEGEELKGRSRDSTGGSC
jgi:hypothetical protein